MEAQSFEGNYEGPRYPYRVDTIHDLSSWMTYLKNLQREASAAYARGDFQAARYHVVHMLKIAVHLGEYELVDNYQKNLSQIDARLGLPLSPLTL